MKVDDDHQLDVDKVLSFLNNGSYIPGSLLYAGRKLFSPPAKFRSALGADGKTEPYFQGRCYLLSWGLAWRIAEWDLAHSVAYNSYGSTSEDATMGRWVAYEAAGSKDHALYKTV